MTPLRVTLPRDRIWLRVVNPDWREPLDPTYAREHGGRWNPGNSFPALYLNADVVTARLQIDRMLAGTPVLPEDLTDDAYALVAATLPRTRAAADAMSVNGLRALGLPQSYPLDDSGSLVPHACYQVIGASVQGQGLHGVWCRSACTDDGRGRELAWFPANRARATPVWSEPLPFGNWRYASSWRELGLVDQLDPE